MRGRSRAVGPVKTGANYNERSRGVYFGKRERKDTAGQKFAPVEWARALIASVVRGARVGGKRVQRGARRRKTVSLGTSPLKISFSPRICVTSNN